MVKMLRLQLFLLIGVCLVISGLEVLGQQTKKCADFNEYCLVHSDCCSKSCLTYLYKCTRNYNGIYPYAFFGERNPSSGTLDDVLRFTFSNFGSVEEMKRHELSQQRPEQRPYGFGTRFSDAEMGVIKESSQDKVRTPTLTENEGNTAQHKEQPATNGPRIESGNGFLETRISEDGAECKKVGLKCYTNDECCTKGCHGFLHQCVT